VSILFDTDLLSLLERKRVPARLVTWLEENEEPLFVSVVSFAELQHGVSQAPATHRESLAAWLNETRRRFASATESLTEPVLVRWKELLSELKMKNRTMTCEDSLIAATALFHGHTVATHNTRHFEPAGVTTIDPLA
jgi:predicted nucleic acid-binding protein